MFQSLIEIKAKDIIWCSCPWVPWLCPGSVVEELRQCFSWRSCYYVLGKVLYITSYCKWKTYHLGWAVSKTSAATWQRFEPHWSGLHMWPQEVNATSPSLKSEPDPESSTPGISQNFFRFSNFAVKKFFVPAKVLAPSWASPTDFLNKQFLRQSASG